MYNLIVPILLQAAPDFMRSIGKIYVVVAVIVLVLLGLFVFVWMVDKRLTKLEQEIIDDE